MPQFEALLTKLWSVLRETEGVAVKPLPLGHRSLHLLKAAGTMLIRHWSLRHGDYRSIRNLYSLLVLYFGDSLVPFVMSGCGVGRSARPSRVGKLRIRRVRRLPGGQPTAHNNQPRQDSLHPFGDAAALDRGIFSAQEDFNYLADMGVPSDIFETAEVEQSGGGGGAGRQDNDLQGFFKPRVINISNSAALLFPDAKPFRMKPRAIRLNMGPCHQIEPETYRQVS